MDGSVDLRCSMYGPVGGQAPSSYGWKMNSSVIAGESGETLLVNSDVPGLASSDFSCSAIIDSEVIESDNILASGEHVLKHTLAERPPQKQCRLREQLISMRLV